MKKYTTVILTPYSMAFASNKQIFSAKLDYAYVDKYLRGRMFDRVFIAKEYYTKLCELPYHIVNGKNSITHLRARTLESDLLRGLYGY